MLSISSVQRLHLPWPPSEPVAEIHLGWDVFVRISLTSPMHFTSEIAGCSHILLSAARKSGSKKVTLLQIVDPSCDAATRQSHVYLSFRASDSQQRVSRSGGKGKDKRRSRPLCGSLGASRRSSAMGEPCRTVAKCCERTPTGTRTLTRPNVGHEQEGRIPIPLPARRY